METLASADVVREFTAFYQTDYHRLTWFLARAGGSPAEAEDVAQEAMLALLHNFPAVRKPRAFVRTVALRMLYRGWDERKRSLDAEQRIAARKAWLETFDANEDVTVVLALLDALPPAQREVFALYTDGFSEKEIAEITGKRESTVRSTLRHARAKAKGVLDPDQDREGGNHGP